MKILLQHLISLLFILILFQIPTGFAQITKIAGFESDASNPGLFGTDGADVYRYSWYYEEWYALSHNGLETDAEIKAVAVADTGYSYVSGVYIIADTAVYLYSWYGDEWLYLYNEGLNRADGIPQLSDIAVYGKGTSSTDHDVFVVSGGEVFEYLWYYDYWYSRGAINKVVEQDIEKQNFRLFPNPTADKVNFKITLEEAYTGKVRIRITDQSGKYVDSDTFYTEKSKEISYRYKAKLPAGMYFCEIKIGEKRFVKALIVK